MWDLLVVLAIIAGAAWYIGRRILSPRQGCGCGCSGGCPGCGGQTGCTLARIGDEEKDKEASGGQEGNHSPPGLS